MVFFFLPTTWWSSWSSLSLIPLRASEGDPPGDDEPPSDPSMMPALSLSPVRNSSRFWAAFRTLSRTRATPLPLRRRLCIINGGGEMQLYDVLYDKQQQLQQILAAAAMTTPKSW